MKYVLHNQDLINGKAQRQHFIQAIEKIKHISKSMRKNILDMALAAGGNSSHFGAGLSIVEITATLYGAIMKYNHSNPEWGERDRFILSKGHGVLGYYTALAEAGFIPMEDLLTFEKTKSYLLGHPVINRKKGIEFSNGSLGMGLSLGIGVALSGKKRGSQFKVYVLIGDGECNEGSVWEAAMAASHFKLDNLIAIVDKNGFQLGGLNNEIMNIENLADKWSSFGWNVTEVDGHNVSQLYDAFLKKTDSKKPTAIIANTVKGKGFSFSENNNAWHHAVLTKSYYDQAIVELNQN